MDHDDDDGTEPRRARYVALSHTLYCSGQKESKLAVTERPPPLRAGFVPVMDKVAGAAVGNKYKREIAQNLLSRQKLKVYCVLLVAAAGRCKAVSCHMERDRLHNSCHIGSRESEPRNSKNCFQVFHTADGWF